MPVERAFICPPGSRIGVITDTERETVMRNSLIYGHYEKALDRESAYEILKARADEAAVEADAGRTVDKQKPAAKRQVGRPRDTLLDTVSKTAARTIGSELGRRLIRGVLGSLLGGKK